MVQAATAGVNPLEFDAMTVGEITVAIEGYHERERQSLVSRVNAVLRGLSTLGKGSSDPYKGLIKSDERGKGSAAFERLGKKVFKPAAGMVGQTTSEVSRVFKAAKERAFWREEE